MKAFFVAALQSALDLSIAKPEDILKHVTCDVLSIHLPRPLWARLLTAALGAPRVDAQLVVETIGVPNLCEHIPAPLIWACIADIGNRSLGMAVSDGPVKLAAVPVPVKETDSKPTKGSPPPPPQPIGKERSKPLAAPPPDVIAKPAPTPPPKVGPAIPNPASSANSQQLADIVAELESESSRDAPTATSMTSPPPSRSRVPTQQRFRQAQTGSGIGRLATNSTRRPQAAIPSVTAKSGARRGETEVEEAETETAVGGDWRNSIAVDEDQLVDWQAEETLTVADDLDDRKR
jgi:hypothetical protein